MPTRLFSLRNVSDDEAEDIRALLSDHQIDFYETSAGNWGISTPGIWLPNEDQLEQAQTLIDDYQLKRTVQQREMHKQLRQEGKQETFWMRLWHDPIRVIIYLALALAILYFSTKPFLSLGH